MSEGGSAWNLANTLTYFDIALSSSIHDPVLSEVVRLAKLFLLME